MNDEQEERERNFLFFGMELSNKERDELFNSQWFLHLMMLIAAILILTCYYYYKFPYSS